MFIQLIIILYICILIIYSIYSIYAREYFASTSQITESSVKDEITDIKVFARKFGYPFECEKGQHYENDEKITERSEKIEIHTDWKNAKPNIETCFSKLVPVLEKSHCNLKHITKPS